MKQKDKEKKKKLRRLRDLRIFSIHFVDDPAVEQARFLIKKRKGGLEMDERELREERAEEEAISKSLEDKRKAEAEPRKEEAKPEEIEKTEDPMKLVKDFLAQIKDIITQLPAPVEEAVKALEKAVEEGYGYPAPEEKSKNPELAKLYEELEKSKRETQKLKTELWAKEQIAKGKPPAVVNRLAEKLIDNPSMQELFEEILKSVPSIELGQKTEEPVKKETAKEIKEKVDKLAKALNWED